MQYQSLVVEEITEADCALLAEENSALLIRESKFTGSRVRRLLFLKTGVGQEAAPNDLLGYAVFKEDVINGRSVPEFHVYESVFIPARGATQNNYIHCSRVYELKTSIGELSVRGVLYAQQNDLTFVCAHVCLRTVLASVLPDADVSYARINEIAGIDHVNVKAGGGAGMGPEQMEDVLSAFGMEYSKIIHEPTDTSLVLPGDYQSDLYGAIESGQPALLGFELSNSGGRHVIPVIGHTFNEDTWVAPATRGYFDGGLSYYPSENWLSTYVVHDDNFGPYYCLPRHFLKKENFRIILSLKRYASETGSVEAEAIALAYLKGISTALVDGNVWMERFKAYAQSGLLVLRALRVSREEYLNHLKAAECWDGQATEESCMTGMESELPDYFWMVEVSAPELFSATRRKFGEILIRSDVAEPKPLNWSLYILTRLPGQILRIKGTGLDFCSCGTGGHVGLFQFPPKVEG
ncbi:hypothetical protein SH580_13215 [Coraliomargarita algicola]|uniref:Uncharacterized protein n=1 Tax=Coraliomargarita algicola TaxID=3092156 RepID=A0ABZ0RH53_9BACT|nr:hypothetical protein [Coraliomargarita sp. J2-16]WPJ94393.1 hypothetical protein SH580_13215 [Coraliomargarita sp. J2-16]